MQTAILSLHVIVCLMLVVLVLLQSGREGMGVIFGGGGNSSVFGSSGAGGILVKLTTFLAVLFIATSLGYNIMTSSSRDKGSVILDVQFEEEARPAAPVASDLPDPSGAPAASGVPSASAGAEAAPAEAAP